MSGGAYDYFCFKLEDFADQIGQAVSSAGTEGEPAKLRLAFAELLMTCATAAKAIEWVDSGDWASGDEVEALQAVFAFQPSDSDAPKPERTCEHCRFFEAIQRMYPNDTTTVQVIRDEMRREEARKLATLTPAQDEGEKA